MDYNLDDLLPYNQSLDIYNNGYAGIKQRIVNIPEKQNYWTVPVLIKSPTKEMNDLRIGLNEVNDKLNKQNQERNNDKEEIKNDIKTNDNRLDQILKTFRYFKYIMIILLLMFIYVIILLIIKINTK